MTRPSDAGEPMSSPHADSTVPAEWRDTFAAICDRYRGRLIRWVTAIFGPRDAEDIAQEALCRLYSRPGLLADTDDPWPWLSVVARNVGRDLARHNSWSTSVDAAALSHVPDDVVVPDEVVARDEGERLAAALRSLTPRERTVIRLRDFDGLPAADIAELLGLTENAVRQQLFRARRRLAAVYVDLGGDSRIGSLVAAVGVRLREAARRLVPYVDDAAPAAAALVLSLPAVAGVLGGAIADLFPGLGGDARPAATAAAAAVPALGAYADVDTRHGTGNALGAARRSPLPPLKNSPRDFDPIVEVHQPLPNGHVDYRTGSPFSREAGDNQDHDILVMVPGTPYGVRIHGRAYRPSPGGPTYCDYIPCPP